MTEEALQHSRFPSDLEMSLGRDELLRLTYEAVGGVEWTKALPVTSGQTPEPVLRTLIALSLAKGIYSANQIESEIHHDPALRYVASNFRPNWNAIRAFRRKHGEQLEECLAILLGLTAPAMSIPSPSSASLKMEAANRLRRSVQADSNWLDD